MKKLIIVIGIIGGCFLSVTKAHTQDNVTSHNITMGLPEVALLATTSGGVNLTLSAATVAGEAVQSSISDSSAYVQFSSVISDAAPRTLSAKFTGTLPGGTTLTARVLNPNANAVGTVGTPVATDVTLTTSDATLVSNIGSCYSGTAADDGYRMKYTWGLDNPSANYADIRATASASLIVTLTLTAAL
ncbi:MAG: hypothetical protein KKG99_10550 [Bacteroidetes bacterium]|nr:hypothetical protein [Bacteroidota bacterium]